MAGGDYNDIFSNLPKPRKRIDWDAPPLPTFPANPADPNYSMPARIGSALGIEAKRAGNWLYNAATVPGDVARGRASMSDPATQSRVMDLASLVSGGPLAGGAPEDALSMGVSRAPKTAVEIATGGAAETAAKPGVTAYHGSPHSFDRFDMSKIGTGEGAQAYGHGLYFAENEGVAKSYRDQLSTARISHPQWGDNIGFMRLDTNFANAAINAAPDIGMRRAEEIGTQISEGLRQGDDTSHMRRFVVQSDWNPAEKEAWKGALDHAAEYQVTKNPGHMYQVGINADPEHFLDWDKPLSEQSSHVQQNLADVLRYHKVPLNNNVGGETTGGQMMGYLQNRFGNDVDPASELSDNNIPGIKYFDQGSRGAGGKGGTQNYVSFSDNIIDILRKYGLPGLGLAAGAGAVATQRPSTAEAAAPPPLGMTLGAQPNQWLKPGELGL